MSRESEEIRLFPSQQRDTLKQYVIYRETKPKKSRALSRDDATFGWSWKRSIFLGKISLYSRR